ncbi:MAG: hypothetical protein AB1724_09785 [Thermodesulfobacteriota bacterium]
MKSGFHRLSISLLLFSISLFIALLLAEGLARVVMKKGLKAVGSDIVCYYYTSAAGEMRIRPNVSAWHVGYDDQPVKVAINSYGFRGPELEPSPLHRVVFLGDSVVFCGGVPWENTFVALLEHSFRQEGFDLEVVNAGLADIGIDQYLLQAEGERLTALKPDLLVVGLYLNDSRPPQGYIGEDNPDQIIRWLERPFLSRSALINEIKYAYLVFKSLRGRYSSHRFQWVSHFQSRTWMTDPEAFRTTVTEACYDWGAAWDPSFAATVYPGLIRIQQICRQRHTRLAVVMFPVSIQVYTALQSPYVSLPQQEFAAFARSRSLPFLDLLPALRRHNSESPIFKDHCHLTKKGNEIAAAAIHEFLKEILLSIPETELAKLTD